MLFDDDLHKYNKMFKGFYDLDDIEPKQIDNYILYKKTFAFGDVYMVTSEEGFNIYNFHLDTYDYEFIISTRWKKIVVLNDKFKNNKKVTFPSIIGG